MPGLDVHEAFAGLTQTGHWSMPHALLSHHVCRGLCVSSPKQDSGPATFLQTAVERALCLNRTRVHATPLSHEEGSPKQLGSHISADSSGKGSVSPHPNRTLVQPHFCGRQWRGLCGHWSMPHLLAMERAHPNRTLVGAATFLRTAVERALCLLHDPPWSSHTSQSHS